MGDSWRRARLLVKPVLMPAIAAGFAAAPHGPGYREVVAAQAFSWAGDVALIGRTRRTFLAGLGSFLAAHLAYVSAYRSRSSGRVLASPGRRRFLLAGTGAAALMGLAAARHDRSLAAPVAVYGVTLATMVAAAAAVDRDQGRGLVLTGASLFLVSDVLIGAQMFLVGHDSRRLEAAVLATYAAGQWCISRGMATAGSAAHDL